MQAEPALLQSYFPAPKTVRGEASFIDSLPTHLVFYNSKTIFLQPLLPDHKPISLNLVGEVLATRVSPNGRLIASIDSRGLLQIHSIALEGGTLNLQMELPNFFLGARALDFSPDNNRLAVVGNGKGSFGRVITINSQMDCGEISGASSSLLTIAFRRGTVCNRIAAGGDECAVKFYHGPAFKFAKSLKTHSGFINQIRYSPKGDFFVSVSSDRKWVLYDGETADVVLEQANAHNGGINGVDWVSDTSFATASSDRNVKLWDVKGNLLGSKEMMTPLDGKDVNGFQVAIKVENAKIYTVTLGGDILELAVPVTGPPHRISSGQRGIITKILPEPNTENVILLDQQGRIFCLTLNDGKLTPVPHPHESTLKMIADGTLSKNLSILTADMQILQFTLSGPGALPKFSSASKGGDLKYIHSMSQGLVCITYDSIFLEGSPQKTRVGEQPSAVSSHGSDLYIGTIKGNIFVFSPTLELKRQFQASNSRISAISFIENDWLLIGDSTGAVKVYKGGDKISDNLGNHTSEIVTIIGHGNSVFTMSFDGKVNLWELTTWKRIQDWKWQGIRAAIRSGNKLLVSAGDSALYVRKI